MELCVFVPCCQLVDKLNTDSNISDMQMDYSDVSCSVNITLISKGQSNLMIGGIIANWGV